MVPTLAVGPAGTPVNVGLVDGELAWREHVLGHGMRVRVRAMVERTSAGRFVARVDLAPVVVSEIF